MKQIENLEKIISKKKAVRAIILVAVILAAGIFGYMKRAETSRGDELWGRSNAKEIDVNSKVAGRVVNLLVKEGDVVKKGQVMARIDRRDLEAQSEQLKANIKALEAQCQQASVVTTLQQGTTNSDVHTAQALSEQAKANLQLAQADYERFRSLVQSGAVSEQTFETYRTKYQVAEAAYAQASAGVNKANSGLLQTPANEANALAVQKKLEQARAALKQLEVSLDETEIRAPFDGVITAKYIEEGSMISLGTPLVAIQDTHDNWVDFKVPETQLGKYHLQQQVNLLGRDGKTKLTGTIVDISKKSEFATQRATSERGDDSDIISFNVKVQVNSDKLYPGMRFQLLEGDS